MKFKTLLILSIALTSSLFSVGQIITEVNATLGQVEIYNNTAGEVDVTNYYLCDFPAYAELVSLNLDCGSLLLQPGEYVVVSNFGMDASDGECGLYSAPDYGNPNAIVSYVEWGSTGHFRSGTAVSGGVWTTGWFVESPAADTWIGLNGEGTDLENWIYLTEATECADNVSIANCDGGMVSTTDGVTAVTLCSMDDDEDVVDFFTTSESTENYQFIITDEDNVILGLPGDSNDFNDAPAGICRVWGLSYAGDLSLEVDDDMDDVVPTDECWELSSNFIQVTRIVVDAGDVSLDDGSMLAYACFGDDETIYTFINNSMADADYVYVVVENDIILEVIDGDSNNFGFMANATCSIYGISYTGDFLLSNGMNLFDNVVTSGCYDISETPAVVITHSPEAGMVSANGVDTAYACLGIPVEFSSTSESNLAYTYVITNMNNELLGIAEDDMFDFTDLGLGSYQVYGLSYANETTLVDNEDVFANDAADQCFEWSLLPATVVVEDADGGMVTTADDESTVELCSMDDEEDIIMFASTSVATTGDYQYIITDADGNLLGMPVGNSHDFNGSPAGTCHVYGFAYTGNLIIGLDENIFETAITDGCGELSTTFITVIRHVVNGGAVETTDGETTVNIVLDGVADVISFSTDSDSDEDYTYIVTDDAENILAVLDGNSNDFDPAEAGECHLYGVSHWGDLTAEVGTSINDISSTGCLDLSSNFVTVIREVIDNVVSLSANAISLYPNPASDFITLNTSELTNASWSVMDQTGRVVLTGRVNSSNETISVNQLAKGVYSIQLIHNNQKLISTFVIN